MPTTNFALDGSAWTLTTDHPMSSYGQPVLVSADGRVFGPGDIVENAPADSIFQLPITGTQIVAGARTDRVVSKADPLVKSFLGY